MDGTVDWDTYAKAMTGRILADIDGNVRTIHEAVTAVARRDCEEAFVGIHRVASSHPGVGISATVYGGVGRPVYVSSIPQRADGR